MPLAAAVAASRVYTGAHYPGDVLAGAALGAGIAVATLRWWPLRTDGAAHTAAPRSALPALPLGQGLIVLVNSASGTARSAASTVRDALPLADVRTCEPGQDLAALLARAATEAQAQGGALGVVGGDGTVNAAAAQAAEHGLPLAVFPGGTLNHFAADLGIRSPQSIAEAVEAGHGRSVDLGRITAKGSAGDAAPGEPATAYFVNTFSIGSYPELVRARESLQKYLGTWPALAVGLLHVLTRGAPVPAVIDGKRRRLWLLFAGNGRYRPPGFAPSYRTSLSDGKLDLRVVDGSHPFARTRLVAAFLTGTLTRSRVYRTEAADHLRIDGLQETDGYARDGEIDPAAGTLLLDKAQRALTVYLPRTPHR